MGRGPWLPGGPISYETDFLSKLTRQLRTWGLPEVTVML